MMYWVKIAGADVPLVRTIIKLYESTDTLMRIAFYSSGVRSLQSLESTPTSITFDMEAKGNPFMELIELIQPFNVNMIVSWKYGVGIFDDAGIRKAELTQEEIDSLDKYTDQYEVQIQNILNEKLDDELDKALRRN
jgi:hypothetical protein